MYTNPVPFITKTAPQYNPWRALFFGILKPWTIRVGEVN